LRRHGLGAPQITDVMHQLKQRGFPVNERCVTVTQAEDEVWKILNS